MVLFNSSVRATNTASPTRPFSNEAVALGGMLALASAMGIGRFVYTPILPTMADALGLTKFDAGLIASANFAGYLAGALLTARTRLRGSQRAWLFGALVVGAMSTAGMGLGGSMTMLLLLRFLGGVASAFVLVLGSALVIDRLSTAGRGRLAAVHFAGVGLGIAVSAALVDTLQAAGAGWRVLWLGCGAAAGIVIPIVASLVPDVTAGRAASPIAPSRSPSKVPSLGRLSLCHGLFGGAGTLPRPTRSDPGHA